MSKVGDWLIDHEENIGHALESGAKTTQDVIAYCKTNMRFVDESFIREQLKLYAGEVLTPEQVQDLDNEELSTNGQKIN